MFLSRARSRSPGTRVGRNEDTGQSGIEHEFDDELRGRPGKMFISVDGAGSGFLTSKHSQSQAKTLS